MIPQDSQQFDSYVPVYDVMPSKWEEASLVVVEQFKKLANAVNIREIGWFLDQELLSGKQFLPGINDFADGGTSQQFRSILRKVIVFPSLSPGANTLPHGISIDANFTLIQLFGAATNATALTGEPLPNGSDTITYNSTNVVVTVASAFTRAVVVFEYIQEL